MTPWPSSPPFFSHTHTQHIYSQFPTHLTRPFFLNFRRLPTNTTHPALSTSLFFVIAVAGLLLLAVAAQPLLRTRDPAPVAVHELEVARPPSLLGTGCRGPAMPSRGFPGADSRSSSSVLPSLVRKWETPKTTKLMKRSFSTTRSKKKKPLIRSSPKSTESPARKARASWRKQKRDNSVARKSKLKEYDDDILDDNDDDDDPNLDPPQNNLESEDDPQICSSYGTTQITGEKEDEKLVVGGLKLCEFPLSIKREINRPHSSVFRIVEFESAARYGDSIGLRQSGVPVLENISYGQLQALSAVPRDNPALLGVPSKETASGSGGGSYVITLPRIVAGSGVTKRLGSAGHLHVVPVHSEWFSPKFSP
ncbi:SWI/SNF complex subunit SWI3C-like isoform X2 [Salvia divinorum]|uniref:SWI/SNF complex subunit SWI3C-like isoform X2 n=1 Tax=Salvia divinorum TaxID=28513 RepID=A0ABD1FUR7_SALDI